jgi:micrococcal nuclease
VAAPLALFATATLLAAPCTVIDGDTLRCGAERIRLLGIDAPEKPGSCRPGRDCVAGDWQASTASLERAIKGQTLRIERVGRDRYGRTLALVRTGRVDLSCHQLAQRQAVYVPQWDNGRRLTRRCSRWAKAK